MKKLIASIVAVGVIAGGAITATSAFADGCPPQPMIAPAPTTTATPNDGCPPQPM